MGMGRYVGADGPTDGRGMRVAIVNGRFNDHITKLLLDGARGALRDLGVADDDVLEVWVPGAFEMPLLAQHVAKGGTVDAVICLGAVIRGDTPHFDFVAGECASGLTRVALDTGVPVIFGVLTVNTLDQALARSGGAEGNKGAEAAATALEMIDLLRRLPGEAR
jgi:6,7-dimethyl-8-ribityllumazine synthase